MLKLLSRAAMTAGPLEDLHGHWALVGWRRFGQRRHPAALNFGDCLSYGLPMAPGAPLVFPRDDLAATDVVAALPS